MKGDFSTIRFDRAKHYNRLLKQQGRVELDSDWNEQTAILQHLMRTMMADLVGPAAGPELDCGFGLGDWQAAGEKPRQHSFLIGPGRYYVDGILVENEAPVAYTAQPHFPDPPLLDNGGTYLAYLDVWERHVTVLEHESLQEVALGGPDTCTRVQTAWAVRVVPNEGRPANNAAEGTDAAAAAELRAAMARLAEIKARLDGELTAAQRARLEQTAAQLEKRIQDLAARVNEGQPRLPNPEVDGPPCEALLATLRGWRSGSMTARLPDKTPPDTPCVLPIESRYRGLENHLYRIEIHDGGDTNDATAVPTFKWSRENGAIATRLITANGADVQVANARGFAAGAWVEVSIEADELSGRPGTLRRIARVEGNTLTLEDSVTLAKGATSAIVRRWDQTASEAQPLKSGAIPITAGTGEQGWIAIEDGIEVQFGGGPYRSGDWWWITARVATGEIDWPKDGTGASQALQPHGVMHHYAPLYLLQTTDRSPFVTLVEDCRCRFARLPCLGHEEKG
ncbi:DUF6519 domain-containing protein [Sabulicella glaciei]|uniref:DUF6519 domain-containing protein n=1 Tax=Sabulicella glaciei TaxID=2984948 RepID=A0ABT3NQ30_9PROT|nr:DUF6519 domain-containing protein [Roseococcus sp. MDT2-1-1]MCW8084266.1 DUF6519 domain-containing protein [Roseococcus sp. MDT2-1-1]